jgi:DNA helicase-2/ATP-dependent DNA helicase PcrA
MDILSSLNPTQQEAVKIVNGPVLVLAGPGSGKTRVLTHRVAYLIGERHIAPYNILAVTFTNKAAREMRERLIKLIGEAHAQDLTIGTFHATCARFLRRDGERVGLGRGFVIYDEDDQSALIKQILKEMNLDDKKYKPGAVLGTISKAKNELIEPANYVPASYWHEVVGRVYQRYQQLLAANNAADFDDLLMATVRLFRENPDVLARYQARYIYLHVDEFQDTNMAQYELMKLLANQYQNLFCVGDEDQSIYGWRGADYRNVLRFSQDFPNAQVRLLEQNYRSTQTILDVAQAIIRKNKSRHKKELWTENPQGIPITVWEAYDQDEEARMVVDEIARLAKQGYRPRDCAIFYRTNFQSRALEAAFTRRGMPYQLVGALRFYQRREVKDILAYLRLIANPDDSVAFNRVLNVPPRGIGKNTTDTLARWAEKLNASPYAILHMLKAQTKDEGQKTDKAAPRPLTSSARRL